MGLDMYLSRKTYVKRLDHEKPEAKFSVTVERGGQPYGGIMPEKVSYVEEELAYWRKANAIHKWFVDHVQDGADDNCQKHYVSKEQLQELVDLCKKVLETVETVPGQMHSGTQYTYKDGEPVVTKLYKEGELIAQAGLAAALLPTQEGFFFGGTDYDGYYLDGVRDTIKMIEPLLSQESEGDYYYHASW